MKSESLEIKKLDVGYVLKNNQSTYAVMENNDVVNEIRSAFSAMFSDMINNKQLQSGNQISVTIAIELNEKTY